MLLKDFRADRFPVFNDGHIDVGLTDDFTPHASVVNCPENGYIEYRNFETWFNSLWTVARDRGWTSDRIVQFRDVIDLARQIKDNL